MIDTILTLRNVSKRYDKQIVLTDISLDVKKSEFLSILGPSGCGKSTLLKLICGIEKPTFGNILKQNVEISDLKPKDRNIGIIFQNYALFPNMTVYDNVAYALKCIKMNKSDIHAKVFDILKTVELFEHKHKKPSQLSGGQQQRCAIARTLVLNPDIILFDEAMSALDANIKTVLRSLIKMIQAKFGTTIIYVTHDVEEAFVMSDRILLLNDSEIVQLDKPTDIYKYPTNQFVKSFICDALDNKLAMLKEQLL